MGEKNKYRMFAVGLVAVMSFLLSDRMAWAMLDNTLQVVELTDLKGDLPLDVVSTTRILWQTEDWEHSSYKNPSWPSGGDDSVRYPTVVKNVHGQNPDGKYYLYYAHHDPMSGIGCAVADSVEGPYTKISPPDSKVLTVPNYNPAGPNPDDPSHYSSPCVVWNEDEGLWFMYFHYFNHYHGAWTANPDYPGEGWQMTGLATCPDLSSHNWMIWTDPMWGAVSVWDIVPVHPTTDEAWSNSASSYNAVQRLPHPLPNGHQWLAFCRGTNTPSGDATVGFATSTDGRSWDYFPENPVIAPGKTWTLPTDEYRPKFIGYLGDGEYLVVWSEHSRPYIIYSKTTDFKTFTRDSRGYASWGVGKDGIVSAWRKGNQLYLFSEKYLYVMNLTVYAPGDFEPDGDVDFNDLQVLAEQWLQIPNDSSADIAPQPYGDNMVNFLDIAEFAKYWLSGVELPLAKLMSKTECLFNYYSERLLCHKPDFSHPKANP